MSYIQSYCRITHQGVWLNNKAYFQSKAREFVLHDYLSEIVKYAGIDYRKFFKMDALSKLGFLASELLLKGIDREQPKPDMGILFFNRCSSLEADINFQKTIQDTTDFFPSPAEFVYTLPNIVTGEIAIRNKIQGETVFYVTDHCQTDRICQMVHNTLSSNGLKCALAGWVDVDDISNKPDCLMMLCTQQEGDNDRNAFLPVGFDRVYTGEKLLLDEDIVCDLYNLNI